MQIAGDMSSSPQAKRRRMLQFESDAVPVPLCNEEIPILDDKVCIVLYINYVCRYPYNHI